MKIFKRVLALVIITLMLLVPTITSNALSAGEIALTISASVDGKTPQKVVMNFSLEKFAMDGGVKDDEPFAKETLTIDTSKNVSIEYKFKADEVAAGDIRYEFKMVSCSDEKVIIDNKIFAVTLGAEMAKTDDSAENVEEIYEYDDPAYANGIALKTTFKAVTSLTATVKPAKDAVIEKVYDGTDKATILAKDYVLSGVREGHDVRLTATNAVYNSANVKEAATVKATGLALAGKDAAKYKLETESIEFVGKITPRPITVTADNIVMPQGSAEPEFTYKTSEEIIEGNTVIGALARISGSEIGDYAILRGTLSFGDNYLITFQEGKFTISNFALCDKVDTDSFIKVSGYFDPQLTLTVKKLLVTDATYKTMQENIRNGKVLGAYNVSLGTDSHDGDITVSFPVDVAFEGKQIYIYQLLSSGAVTSYKTAAVSGYVSLKTNEISDFMIVLESDGSEKPKTPVWKVILTIVLVILGVLVGLAVLAGLWFFGMIFFNKTEELKAIIKKIKKIFKK